VGPPPTPHPPPPPARLPSCPPALHLSPQECGLLREGTVLLADNVIYPGAPDFLEYVRGNSRFECSHFSSYLEYSKVVDGLEKVVYKGLSGPARP